MLSALNLEVDMTGMPTRQPAPAPDEPDQTRTPAQWYCLAVGATLTLAGLLGFTADATFDTEATDTTPGGFQGDGFLGFEVNGWHNVVHLVSGLVLLALHRRRSPARVGALAFGLTYAVVAVIGIADGDNVLGLIPVNAADNVLHPILALLGLGAGFASRGDDRDEEQNAPGAASRREAARSAIRERPPVARRARSRDRVARD